MKYRFYISTNEGLRRLPIRAFSKALLFPQFAGTRQKKIQVIYEWRAGHLFLAMRGFYVGFDARGHMDVSREDMRKASELVQASSAIELQRIIDPSVASADDYRRVKELRSESEWKPSEEDLAAITVDLMSPSRPPGTKPIPLLKSIADTIL